MTKHLFIVLSLFSLMWSLTSCRPELEDVQVTVMATVEVIAVVPTRSSEESAFEGLFSDEAATPVPTLQPTIALPTRAAGYDAQPTPDAPHYEVGNGYLIHTVQAGDTLATIANRYQVELEAILASNELTINDFIQVDQQLNIPTEEQLLTGPALKLIPDSELVYGPAAEGFDVDEFTAAYNGYLRQVTDEVEGRTLTGPEVVDLVATRFSVNPRLLLAALEFRTGWVTRIAPPTESEYMMGFVKPGYEGLYQQLGWAANQLNFGYYGRGEGGLMTIEFTDGTKVLIDPTINHGTAGVQQWLSAHSTANFDTWQTESGPDGFYGAYSRLFGSPFAYAYEPLYPAGLDQPDMALPWAEGEIWYFTGGPHGGWAPGSAWAALDFAPDKDQLGCYLSESWVTASMAGEVIFSDMGGVIVDSDGDGFIGTGWVTVYWHIDTSERIAAGEQVSTGDQLGHPSCEGGFSNGTHLHFARRYNGHWISADGDIPFELDGWVSSGAGREYDGYLVRGDETREACVCAEDEINGVSAE